MIYKIVYVCIKMKNAFVSIVNSKSNILDWSYKDQVHLKINMRLDLYKIININNINIKLILKTITFQLNKNI